MKHYSDVGQGQLQVVELFGPTIQGEGIMTGTVTHFLRTGGCGLRCSWCDSMYAVDPVQIQANRVLMTTDEILRAIKTLPPAPYVTFTGGDPAIQKRLGDLIPKLNYDGMRVAVETQGQYFPDWFENCDVITFSPKGPSSGNIVDPFPLINWLTEHRASFTGRICIKVVVFITGEEFAQDEVELGGSFQKDPEKTDLEYAWNLYKVIPEQLYDAFYFTAGTHPYTGPFEDPGARVLQTVHSERLLAESMLLMLKEGGGRYKFNYKVRLGCQQHVLLWPQEEKGV